MTCVSGVGNAAWSVERVLHGVGFRQTFLSDDKPNQKKKQGLRHPSSMGVVFKLLRLGNVGSIVRARVSRFLGYLLLCTRSRS